jgi:hypothetical protein
MLFSHLGALKFLPFAQSSRGFSFYTRAGPVNRISNDRSFFHADGKDSLSLAGCEADLSSHYEPRVGNGCAAVALFWYSDYYWQYFAVMDPSHCGRRAVPWRQRPPVGVIVEKTAAP